MEPISRVPIVQQVEERIRELIQDEVGGFVDKMFNERLLSVLSTKENVNLETLGFAETNVKNIRRSSLRSRLPESVWEPSSFTNAMNSMILMILFSGNTERRL